MIHAMIDLETLSTRPEAVILTLGGIKFNPHLQEQPHDPLYLRVDVDSQTKMGRHVMQETLDWWAKQPPDIAEDALSESDRCSLEDTTRQFNKWCVGVEVFWCQGPLFDYAILQHLYAQLNKPCPWNYWQIRDSRTLFSLLPQDDTNPRPGYHNALADADYQAKKVQKYYQQLKLPAH